MAVTTPGEQSRAGTKFKATRGSDGARRICDYVLDLDPGPGVCLIAEQWSDEYGGAGNGATAIHGTPQQYQPEHWLINGWWLTPTTEGRETPRHNREAAAAYARADAGVTAKP